MNEFCRKHPSLCAYFGSVAIVGAAFAFRTWLLGGFGPAIPYLTFYPAVMLSSLLGGLYSGLLAALLSGLLATHFFIEPVGSFSITNSRDFLGLLAFLAGSALMSVIGERHIRHRAKLKKSVDEQVEVNAKLKAEIEDRENLAKRLTEQEQRFRTLANSGQALIWTSTPDKLCDYFNEPWLAFTGRTLEQELGNGWTDGVHPDDFQRCLSVFTSAFDRREHFSMEYRLRHASGEYRWIIDQGTPRHDGEGIFLGYIGHCLDITGVKQTEEQLRASRAELAERNAQLEAEIQERHRVENELRQANEFSGLITEMSASLFVVLDRQGVIVRFNKACESATGYWAEEVIGREIWDVLVPVGAKEQARQAFLQHADTDFPRFRETSWLVKDGSMRQFYWSEGAILNDQGEVEFIIRTGMDLTAAKREMNALEGLSAPLQTSETASTLGLGGLNQTDPAKFAELTDEFENLMDLALENRVLKVEHDVPKGIDRICEILGSLRAGPRETTALYVAALKRKVGKVTPSKYQAYSEEGRIMFIELMGKLAAYYRNHCLGAGPRAGIAGWQNMEEGHE